MGITGEDLPGDGRALDDIPDPHFQNGMDEHGADLIAVRELEMMAVMNTLTDKAGWANKIHDDGIVAKWQAEALARKETLLTEDLFIYCIEELKVKAVEYQSHKLVPALDGQFVVVKSDEYMPSQLKDALQRACNLLMRSQASNPDWHPDTHDMVWDLVHPSLYPLVYGRSRIQPRTPGDRLSTLFSRMGNGTVVPSVTAPDGLDSFYSRTFQWLPCDVSFRDSDLSDAPQVRIDSIVNNLHPRRHAAVYPVIEQLIDRTLPLWNRCLVNLTDEPSDGRRLCEDDGGWDPPRPDFMTFTGSEGSSGRYDDVGEWDPSLPGYSGTEDTTYDTEVYSAMEHAQVAWERNNQEKIIHPSRTVDAAKRWRKTQEAYVDLEKQFGDTGLQIIVKIASIELTPEKPLRSAGSWHLEGQMNEHICATALWYFDSDNVSDSSISFRQHINEEQSLRLPYEQSQFGHLAHIFGRKSLRELGEDEDQSQEVGTVATVEGRVLAFPNFLQHYVSHFELLDKSRSGHKRFVALWLVDPHIRVLSTGNVAPQQFSWWSEEIFRSSTPPGTLEDVLDRLLSLSVHGSRLPREIRAMILSHLYGKNGMPMSDRKAKQFREKLMEERTVQREELDDVFTLGVGYNFCEH